MIGACLAFAACGGEDEAEQPDTQVAVPTQEATPVPTGAAEGQYPSMPGYLLSVDNERARLLTEDGRTRSFWIAPEEFEQIGVPHLASHAGFTELGFLLTYEKRGKRNYLLSAQEIAPPFPFPSEGTGGE
jgi:hypothetical protein